MDTNHKSHSFGKLLGGRRGVFEFCDDDKDAYDLTRLFLVEILNDNFPRDGNIDRRFAGTQSLH